jgi:dTDP-4-dehydrorhamnose reductase
MKLWIIGAKGMLGSTLRSLCQERLIENVGTAQPQVDITRLEQIKKFSHSKEADGITHIVNCAAYTDVDRAEKEADLAYAVNALGPENIGTIANELKIPVIHISTDYVFPGKSDRPYTETDPCQPISVYGKTKWEGENNLLDVCPSACIIRSSWLFGKRGKNFISSILDKMKKEKELRVVADQKGRPTFARDLSEAILSMLCHTGIYHFANEGEVSRFQMAESMLFHALDLKIPILCRSLVPVTSDIFPMLAKRPAYSVLCTDKISSVLGEPPRHWETALKEYLQNA